MDAYLALRPLFFGMEPEAAHRFTLGSLRRLHRLGLLSPAAPAPWGPARRGSR